MSVRPTISDVELHLISKDMSSPRASFCRWFFVRMWRLLMKQGLAALSDISNPAQGRLLQRSAFWDCRPPNLQSRDGRRFDAVWLFSLFSSWRGEPRRLHARLEHIQRIDAARVAVVGNEDRVAAAADRADNHQIVRQVKTFDPEIHMPFP